MRRDGPSSRYRNVACIAAATAVGLGIALIPTAGDAETARADDVRRRMSAPVVVTLDIGQTARADRDLRGALRGALTLEASTMTHVRLAESATPARGGLVLHANVTEFERTMGGADYRVRCAVSIIVTDARGGSIRFLLNGRASATADRPRTARQARSLEDAALRAAVRSALRPMTPSAIAAVR